MLSKPGILRNIFQLVGRSWTQKALAPFCTFCVTGFNKMGTCGSPLHPGLAQRGRPGEGLQGIAGVVLVVGQGQPKGS